MLFAKLVLLCALGLVAAYPAVEDPVIAKWTNDGPRYAYLEADDGTAHLVDHWVKLSDLQRMARYEPDSENAYHVFTRENPTLSQPLVLNDVTRLLASNFNPHRPTIMVMHGFAGSATSDINTVLVPAYLTAQDCNVIVLDWSAGSYFGLNAIRAGQAAGRFINWVNSVTGSHAGQYTITGYSVGGHGAGIIARNVNGFVAYVIGLDPAERWDSISQFKPTDALYTEVIHTSSMGEQEPLAHVDFYPNGGQDMPGCLTAVCDHARSYYFLAESVVSGGFTGRRCATVQDAYVGTCNAAGTLHMGGLVPKFGQTGIYYLETNRFQPFSQG